MSSSLSPQTVLATVTPLDLPWKADLGHMQRTSKTISAIVGAVMLVAIALPIGTGSIAHAAGGTITGVVRNAQGTPIPSATVRAMRDEAGFVAPPVTVTADANGAFSITGLAPADYRIGAAAAGYAARYANADTWALATTFTVTGLSNLTSDITLFQPTATISGRIIDDLGAPVVGATVNINSPAWPMGMYPIGIYDPFGRVVTTDAGGHYSATGFAQGSYNMSVTSPTTSLIGGVYPTLKQPGSSFAVGVGATVTGIDLTLLHAGTVKGRITSPAGAPVSGANVLIEGWGSPHQTSSAADGTYTITGVEPGPQIMLAQVAELPYMTTLYGNVLTGPEATPINVPVGGTISGMNIHLIQGVDVQMHVLDINGQAATYGQTYGEIRGCRMPDSLVRIPEAPSPLLDCQHSIGAGETYSTAPNGDALVRFPVGDYNVATIMFDYGVTSTATLRVVLGDAPTCTLRRTGTSHCSSSPPVDPPPVVTPPPPPVSQPPVSQPQVLVCSTVHNGSNTPTTLVTEIGDDTKVASCAYAPAVRLSV
ncbi:MAG: carboxypeptidase regulatory-like protein [Ilumatobacteraceae bacterium]|nr:carboxypeptidase regulatory-like protein [Ilumatobacteraceae bacterium]